MKPLKIAFLWHQHQPYYKMNDTFILPWVRMHGVKDYYDIPALLRQFPKIKQTFNLVPSLLKQIEEYLAGIKDSVQSLSMVKANDLSKEQKLEILEQFFVSNLENMILKYRGYKELYDLRINAEQNVENFDNSYWLDLQCWYNLCWIGEISKQDERIAKLFEKQRYFTEDDKIYILDYHKLILNNIVKIYKELNLSGQIELSITPFFHPILPLLCNTDIAKLAQPELNIENNLFSNKEDAEVQIAMAQEYFRSQFRSSAKGMWPSEGSISEDVLVLMINNDIKWTAADEGILQRSMEDYNKGYNKDYNKEYNNIDKYFPYKYKYENKEIVLFFRDHHISDKIGFSYSTWNHIDAVNDFLLELYSIKNNLVGQLGEEVLDDAIITIILDGENCWEFYPDNGIHFLSELYRRFSETADFETITFADYLNDDHNIKNLNNIFAGSWINSNFDIWIGQREHQDAWKLLAEARKHIKDNSSKITESKYKEAMQYIYIAEGSDWFWWYYDNHQAPNKHDFDVLFRWNLRKVYEILGDTPPVKLYSPIGQNKTETKIKYPQKDIDFDGIEGWGFYLIGQVFSTMHIANTWINKIYFAKKNNRLLIKFKSDINIEMIELITPDGTKRGELSLADDYSLVAFSIDDFKVLEFKLHIKYSGHSCTIPDDEFIKL